MAVTAKFTADFSSFQDAVAKADVQLRGFESNAGRVEKSLNRMTDAFSGRKIIQDATLVAQAVENIGGASKLTETELQKVAALATEAATKLKALGQDVPPQIAALASQLKATESPLERIAFNVGKAIGGFLAFETVKTAFVSLLTSTVEFASHLDDLSKATGINTDALQELGFAGKRVGVDLDEIANSVGQLSKRLATGDGNAVAALQSLGLNIDRLKTLAPQDLFIEVAEAVGRITDPLSQAGIGSELFGKKFQSVLQLSKDGLRDTMKQAEDFGAVLGADAVKTLDQFGDSVGDLTTKLKVLAAEALTPVVGFLNSLLDVAKQTNKLTFVDPKAEEQFKKLGAAVGTEFTGPVKEGLKIVGQAALDLAAGAQAPLTPMQLLENRLKAIREELDKLSPKQKEQITRLQALGLGEKEIANAVGISEAALKSYLKTQEAAKKAAEELAKALKTELEAHLENIDASRKAGEEATKFVSRSLAGQNVLRDLSVQMGTTQLAARDLSDKGIAYVGDESERTAAKMRDLKSTDVDLSKVFGDLAITLTQLATIAGPSLGGVAKGIGEVVIALKLMQEGSKTLEAFKESWTSLSTSQKVATGVLVGTSVAADLVADKTSKASAILSGAAKGAQIGSIVGPWGTVVGAAVGAIVGAFHNAEKAVNPVREAFVQSAGGLDALSKKAMAATGSLKLVQDLLNAKNVDQYTKAINALNAAFGLQDQAMADLQSAIDEYGFTLEELPRKLGQDKLNAQFLDLYKKEQLLVAAGFDLDAVIQKQAKSYQELVTAAIKTGETIPTQLKPILQRMVDLGLLTDESGDKLTDLSKLNFADTLDDKFKTLIDTIQKLADVIANSLGGAIRGLPPVPTGLIGTPEASGGQGPIQAAAGFSGVVRRPTLFLAGERGAERVNIGPADSGGGDLVLQVDGSEIARVVNFRNSRSVNGRKRVAAA